MFDESAEQVGRAQKCNESLASGIPGVTIETHGKDGVKSSELVAYVEIDDESNEIGVEISRQTGGTGESKVKSSELIAYVEIDDESNEIGVEISRKTGGKGESKAEAAESATSVEQSERLITLVEATSVNLSGETIGLEDEGKATSTTALLETSIELEVDVGGLEITGKDFRLFLFFHEDQRN